MGPNTPGCQRIDRDTLDRHFRQAVTGLQSLYSPTTKAEQYSRLNALPRIVCFLSRIVIPLEMALLGRGS